MYTFCALCASRLKKVRPAEPERFLLEISPGHIS
jgi:hypothetical protein